VTRVGRAARLAIRGARSLWLFAGICLLALVALDRLAMLWVDARERRDSLWRLQAEAYRDEPWAREVWLEFPRISFQWEPFAYYRASPFAGRFHNVDDEGRRRTWNRAPADPSAIDVWVFGGSTAWGFGERDDGTIPSALSRLLADAGWSVRVENRAQIGYVSTQEVIALQRALLGSRAPRVVIFYDGFNDVLSLLRNDRAGLSLDESGRANAFELDGHTLRLARALERHSGLDRLFRYAPPPQTGGAIDPDRLEKLLPQLVDVYAANVRLVEDAGRAAGFTPIFFWQPTLHSPKKLESPWERKMAAFEQGFTKALHERAHHAVCDDRRLASNPHFHDLDAAFAAADAPLFVDRAHLNQAGNTLVARRILDDVVPVLQSLQKKIERHVDSADPRSSSQ